jgi:hypothetical protein
MNPSLGANERSGPTGMSKESRERLAKALEESRRAEKEIIEADAREDDEQTERIVGEIQKSAADDDST